VVPAFMPVGAPVNLSIVLIDAGQSHWIIHGKTDRADGYSDEEEIERLASGCLVRRDLCRFGHRACRGGLRPEGDLRRIARMTGGTRIWLLVAGILGALAVVAGALGAHVSDPAAEENIATAERYHMWHVLALLAVAWLVATPYARLARVAGILFVTGIVLFSGSLYLSAATGWRGITVVTPVGGVSLILGWLDLALAGFVAVRPAAGGPPRDADAPPPPQS
jgi:uncharacterized membrane protein YgdD (TMEM256/DUF423 family)